jgi:hypothetical protein
MTDFTRFNCPACRKRLKAPRNYALRKVRCACGERMTVPEETSSPAPAHRPAPARPGHTLKIFSAGLTLLLGLLTASIFATVRLCWLHGKFPKKRPSDPTATRAIVGAFIPGFNLFWGPFVLGRLITRLNEQRREVGLPEFRLYGLVVAFVGCMLTGYIVAAPLRWLLDDGELARVLLIGGPLLNWFLIVPLLATSVQNGVNALVEASNAKPGGSTVAFLLQTELKWRCRQRTILGVYLSIIAFLHLSLVTTVLAFDRGSDRFQALLMNFLCITLPLAIGVAALFTRAGLMAARRARVARDSTEAESVVAAERRTTMIYLLAWSVFLALAGFLVLCLLVTTKLMTRGLNYYTVLDELLLPTLLFVLPTWVGALHCLVQAYGTFAIGAKTAESPVMGLQAAPTAVWPTLGGAVMAVLLIGLMALWSRTDRGMAVATGVASNDTVRAVRANEPKLSDGALVGIWRGPAVGEFSETFAYFENNGKGRLRGTFAGGGGIHWEFTYEIDQAENAANLFHNGVRKGSAELSPDARLHVIIPDVEVFGPELTFRRDD